MSIRAACPFCNTSSVLSERPSTGRAVCHRCGEQFSVKDAEEVDEQSVEGQGINGLSGVNTVTDSRPARFLDSNKGILISTTVTLIALGIGTYLLWPPGSGNGHKPGADARPPATVPPPALAGLRFLPAGTNIAFAVQPAPLLAYAERTKSDPKAMLTSIGVPAELLSTLDRMSLSLDQIDHIAGGVTVPSDGLFPGFALVLLLRHPLADEERFLQGLRAEKKPKAGRPTYAVTAGLPLTMTKVDDRTYLFGLLEKDLSAADARPETPPLAPALRDALTTKLSPATFAWLATDDERWTDKAVIKAFVSSAKDPAVKERFARLGQGRQVVAGIALEPDPRLRVVVRTESAAAAAAVREFFSGKLAAQTVTGEGEWAEADMPIDPRAPEIPVRKLLSELR